VYIRRKGNLPLSIQKTRNVARRRKLENHGFLAPLDDTGRLAWELNGHSFPDFTHPVAQRLPGAAAQASHEEELQAAARGFAPEDAGPEDLGVVEDQEIFRIE
jgi:hypothetical protein